MLTIGAINNLRIVKRVDFGLYLDGEEAGEILLPSRYVPSVYELDEYLNVFIYKDSEDRIIATTETPAAMVGEFAYLICKSVDRFGAFLDWNLMKDLLVPFNEQQVRMIQGKRYLVRVYIDEKTMRIAASSRIDKFLDLEAPPFVTGQEVNILIANKTDIGYKVIINNSHSGIIYSNEIFGRVSTGQKMKAFISKIRDDNKIDVCLNKPGFEKIDKLERTIIEMLKENSGFLPYGDKSDSEEISRVFHASKKTFKKAIGALYKWKKIIIVDNGIRLQGK